MNRTRYLSILLVAVMFLIVGCGLLGTQALGTGEDPQAVYTQAVQTLQAQLTQQAFDNLVKQLTQSAAQPTATATLPPASPTATLPTSTQVVPTATSAPPTSQPTATSVPIPCNQAEFVGDVTISDGTIFTPGSKFTKVWRLRNTGSCTWDDDYSLVYVSGDRMKGTRELLLDEVVRPGGRLDVSVDLEAPNSAGRYQGFWMLSDHTGARFGIGKQARDAFWVEIRVKVPNSSFDYDFAVNLCAASWESSAGDLRCPGDSASDAGSVVLLDRPNLENDRTENESTLWIRPEATRNGWISGIYPEYKIREYDHFLADVGCLADSKGCAVTFSLGYETSNGKYHSLGEWYEEFDGQITRIKIDLTSLAGQEVQFVLGVSNEGKAGMGNAFWLVPSIRNIKPSPSPEPVWTSAQKAATQKIAQDLSLDASTLSMVSVTVAEWKDSCLGVQLPDQVCSEVVVPGYSFVFEAANRRFEAHTDNDGTLVFWFEL